MAEPLRATFFTLKKRERAVLLPATLTMLVLVGLIIAAFVALNWTFLSQAFEMIREAEGQLGEEEGATFAFGFLGFMASVFLCLIPIYLVLAAYEAACLRWMIRGEAPGVFGITFNNDTWRVYGVYWCWLIAQFAVSMVIGILMLPITFMMMAEVAAVSSDPGSAAWWSLQARMQGLSLLQYIPLAYLGIRLGPAAATSVARNRFSFFDAWVVTRGRFWALFGSFALLWVLVTVAIVVLVGGAYAYLFADLVIAAIQSPTSDHTEAVRAAFDRVLTPQGFAIVAGAYLVYFLVIAIYMLMAYGVNARAALAALEEGKISVHAGDD